MFKPGIGFNCNVSNLEHTLDFFTERLGFKVLNFDSVNGQAMISTNSRDCFIRFAEEQPVIPSSTCITFEVENIEQAVLMLQQKGVEFTGGILEVPNVVKLAEFTDPDGYKLMLYEQV